MSNDKTFPQSLLSLTKRPGKGQHSGKKEKKRRKEKNEKKRKRKRNS